MLKIKCDICGKELNEPGALLFSPPNKYIVHKYHICKDCYKTKILNILKLETDKDDEQNEITKDV